MANASEWKTLSPDYLTGYRDAVVDTMRRIADKGRSHDDLLAEAARWEAMTVTAEGLR